MRGRSLPRGTERGDVSKYSTPLGPAPLTEDNASTPGGDGGNTQGTLLGS